MANGFLPKPISGLLITVMIANSVLFALIFQPQPALAGLPVAVVADVPATVLSIWDRAWNVTKAAFEKTFTLKTAAFETLTTTQKVITEITSALLVLAIQQVLTKITKDTIAWINGGGKGKILILQDPAKLLADSADAAGGALAGELLNLDPKTLCNADYLKFVLKPALTGPYAIPTFDEVCTFSGMADGLRKFQEDFRYGGWASFIQLLDKPNNHAGQALLALEELKRIEATKTQTTQAELAIGGGFLDKKKCVITKGRADVDDFTFLNRTVEEVINDAGGLFRGYNTEEFKGYWIQQGGLIDCKTITPAETVKTALNDALLGPKQDLQQAMSGLTTLGGTKVGMMLKPFLLAIGGAAFNQITQEGKGLVNAYFAKQLQKKDRRNQRQPSDSLQNNAQLAQSAGALSGSVNDFRSFLLKSLIEFNIFVSAAMNIANSSNEVFGRTPLDNDSRPDLYSSANTPPNPPTYPPATSLEGPWHRGMILGQYGPGDQYLPYVPMYERDNAGNLVASPFNKPDENGVPQIYRNTMTNYAGKVFDEEAQWCGAYSEEIPITCPNQMVCDTTAGETCQNDSSLPYYGACRKDAFLPLPLALATTCIDHMVWLVYKRAAGSTLAQVYILGSDRNSDSSNPATAWFGANCGDGTPGDGTADTDFATGTNGSRLAFSFDWADIPTTVPSVTVTLNYPPNFSVTYNKPALADISVADNPAPVFANMCPGCDVGGAQYPILGLVANWANTVNNVVGTSTTEIFWEKYPSPTFEGGSVTLRNKRVTVNPIVGPDSILYDKPLTTVTGPDEKSAVLDQGRFYPELMEKIQELMERVRTIEGYHFPPIPTKDYLSPLADQLGAVPDDDPRDSDPKNQNYFPRVQQNIVKSDCSWPATWTPTALPLGACSFEAYKGSVSDVTTRYNDLNQIYQALFAGLHDENSLEGVDKDFKILSPEENNIRLALIGKRCPVLPPSVGSATSTPELIEKCPRFGDPVTGEYNMARKFIFEKDTVAGVTTGFATNPFTGEKSSSLAGMLNLEDMTAQLGSLPPDKNIVKLIRVRQLLEQLQVWKSMNPISPDYQKALGEIKIPKRTTPLYPDALTGVDTVLVSLSGYEKIQDWLNATSTTDSTGTIVPAKNQDIQTLIEAYGYTTAKEAYPQISKELDDILDDITNQITDKLKDVFLKRTELALETARVNMQERLSRFVEYVRDLNPEVKLEIQGSDRDANNAALVGPTSPYSTQQTDSNVYILKINAKDPTAGAGFADLTPLQKNGLIGSAVYKIKTLAKFLGIDTNTSQFRLRIENYTRPSVAASDAENAIAQAVNSAVLAGTPITAAIAGTQTMPEWGTISTDVNTRITNVLEDVYAYYAGISEPPGALCVPITPTDPPCAMLSDTTSRIYKDAKIKLDELNSDPGLMLEEINKVKEEFRDLISDVTQQKQSMQDMTDKLQTMLDDYAQGNVCVGAATDATHRWRLGSFLQRAYEGKIFRTIAGASLIGGLSGSAIIGGLYMAALIGATAALAAATLGVSLVIVAAVAYFGSRKAKRKRAAAERARIAALGKCAEGMDNFNRKLGQIADDFVCGKTNRKYEEKF